VRAADDGLKLRTYFTPPGRFLIALWFARFRITPAKSSRNNGMVVWVLGADGRKKTRRSKLVYILQHKSRDIAMAS